MDFPAITDLLQTMHDRLASLSDPSDNTAKLFQDVRMVCVSGYDNLFELLPDLAFFPCALVAAGPMSFPDLAATREAELVVITIDQFRVDPTTALATYQLLEQVSQAITGTIPGVALPLAGYHLLPQDIQPLELDSTHTAWQFSIKATAGFI